MYIDTSEDLNYDPTKTRLPLPPLGIYPNIDFEVIDRIDGQTKNNEAKMDIVFEIKTGELIGFQFKLSFIIGSSNPVAARIARENLIAIVSAITANPNIHKSGGFNFDEKLYYKPFNGTLTVAPQTKKDQFGKPVPVLDSNGNQYSQGSLSNLMPISGAPQQGNQPAGQPQQNNYQQPTQQNNQAGQPQNSGQPSWKRG